MKKIYDVVVVGSGPASAAFLYEVADSYSVAVISKKAFRKVCGGLLSPTSIKVLSDMGLTIPKSLYVTPELHVIRTIDLRDGLVRYYPRSYANIDRCLFDSWLMSLVSGKYDLYNGVCTGFEKVDGLYRVSFTENGEKKFLVCRSIIGCDGASSVVRKCITGEKHRKDIYIAIQQWFKASECEGQESENAFSCIFDNVSTDSYTWSFRKGDRIAFGGAYPKENSLKRFESEKMKLSDYGIFFGTPLSTEACTVVFGKKRPKFLLGMKTEKIYLAGESAGLISPSSLEGISWALVSGRNLGKIFTTEKNIINIYSKKMFPQRIKLRLKFLKSIILCSPILRCFVMRSGLSSVSKKKINRIFSKNEM